MKKILYLLSIAFVLTACEDMSMTVDLDLPEHEPLLVVNSIAESGVNLTQVYVSHSIDPLSSDDFEYVTDASVVLKENNVLMDEMFCAGDPIYFYTTHEQIEEGKTYQLEINHPSYPTTTTEVTAPVSVAIQSVVLGDTSEYTRELQFTISDPEEGNYYLLKVFENDGYGWHGVGFETADPSFEDKGLIEDGYEGRKVMFNDQLFNGMSKTFSLDIDYWEGIDSVKVQLYTVSESFYKYHVSRKLQNQSERGPSSILGAEPVVVYSNVQNGFGVFAVKSKNEFVVATN